PVLPLYRSARSVRIAWGRNIPRRAILATLPIIAYLHYAQAAGEVAGYIGGPGHSARRLR
ncbi:MAG TPA: hypothetical protein VFN76_06715, partial [Candidatus Limnocylindria bacterium]|nr:hypothetical protein [Candidatus Limnocylindria bacterium]